MELIIITQNELFKLIYNYYPQNCEFDSQSYRNSVEHLRLNKIVKDKNMRYQVSIKSYDCLKRVFSNYHITKLNNDYYPGVSYSVLLHKNQPILDDDEDLLFALNGKRFDLDVYVSLLSKCYYICVVETLKIKDCLKFSVIDDTRFFIEEINKLDQSFSSLNFIKLDSDIICHIVPNVETELLDIGNVRIFNCLFTDLIQDLFYYPQKREVQI
ncbi:hypothetical protein AGMMS49975_22000 [Clostridia bacterium]|nr:hypothetical protein AGMMS49975_22000 [Clostridia bacterium]